MRSSEPMSSSTGTVSSVPPIAGPVSTGPGLVLTLRRLLNGVGALLGVAPFVIFTLMFLILPSLYLMVQAFQDPAGNFTLQNIAELAQPRVLNAFDTSLKLSAATALLGTLFGLLVALAIIRGRLPGWLRAVTMTFSGVASNFAGVPLAFAFLAMLGRLGIVTIILKYFGIDIYRAGFDIVSFTGLVLTYLYFQVPLMILIIAPAIDGLRKEWSEAAQTLGASNIQFWRYVGLPVLWPNLLGTLSLLFANAFGAIATAYALAGSGTNIVPILLFSQIRGDVLHNPGVGAALALTMIVITAIANIIYLVVRSRAERWLK
jgi:putative spermidine/putrescine transport system permease protein